MSVITISGQPGTSEEYVAGKVAESLGYRLVDRPMILDILKQYGIVEYDKLLDTPPHLFDGLAKDKRSANDLLNSIYLLFAKRGKVVISSKRAFISLEPFLNAFTIYLKADPAERLKKIMEWYQLGRKDADNFLREEEERRMGIIESMYNRKIDSLSPWTMVLDIHKLGLEKCIEIIVNANKKIAKADEVFGWQNGIPTTDTIETDPVMENTIDSVLGVG